MSSPKVVDKKSEVTFKTIETLRGSSALIQEFLKVASSYQKSCQKMAEDGKKFADIIQKIGQSQSNDVGEGIVKLAEVFRSTETKRETMARIMQDDLINAVQKAVKPEENELTQFESDYKKTRENFRGQIQKLEQNSKKAGKKGGDALKQSIASLNDKVKEADQLKAEKLRQVLMIERKRYCNFLMNFSTIIQAEIDMCSDEAKFKEGESSWKSLANSAATLPAALEALINEKQAERTFVPISGSTDNLHQDYYNDYSHYDDANYNYGGGAIQNNYNTGYGTNSYLTATALYDFAGEQPGDLPFYNGEVISVTKPDDGSGWMTGELNGRTGIFPSSYVQLNQ